MLVMRSVGINIGIKVTLIQQQESSNQMKILVILPAWVGDIIMAQSFLKVIKQQMNCQVDVVVMSPFKGLLRLMPEEVSRIFKALNIIG